jgi:hypothetical protein
MILAIDYDPDTPGISTSNVSVNRAKNDYVGKIQIRKLECGADGLTMLAHETGHAIADFLELPASVARNEDNNAQTRLAQEKEAWTVADKMELPINSFQAAGAFESYKTHAELEAEFQALAQRLASYA